MKRFLIVALASFCFSTAYAAEVGISISLGQPGFYGQIDIGDYPPPRLIYAEPVIIENVVVVEQPIYLRVQPDHVKHWATYCSEYRACGQRVYFVEDSWYEEVYVTDYRKKHGNEANPGHKKHDNKNNKGKDKQH
jgi:hypothetical protein